MSTTTTLPRDLPAPSPATLRMGGFALVLFVIGISFSFTEHSRDASLAEDFSPTLDQIQDVTSGGNFTRQFSFLAILGTGVLCLALSARRPLYLRPAIAVPAALAVCWCAASVLWSVEPGVTLRKLIPWSALLVAAFGIGRAMRPRDFVRLVSVFTTVSLAAGIFWEVSHGTFRPWHGDYRFSGTLHPNTQGVYLIALALSSFSLWMSDRASGKAKARFLVLVGIALVFLVLTKSRTSLAATVLGLSAFWVIRTPKNYVIGLASTGIWCLLFLMLLVSLTRLDPGDDLRRLALMGREEQSESLTGRLPLWRELIPIAQQRPLLGHGLQTFWSEDRIADIHERLQWPIREAHNGYLDGWLAVGMIGVGLILWTIISSAVSAARFSIRSETRSDPFVGFALGFFAAVALVSCTESGMTMPMFLPFVAICCVVRLGFFTPRPNPPSTAS